MIQVDHVARVEQVRNTYKVLIGNMKGRWHFGNLGVDVRVILKCVLKWGMGICGFIWLSVGRVSSEFGN
jgi:hypothetical protein